MPVLQEARAQAVIAEPPLAALLERLYTVISFEEGDEPDWQGLNEVFSKHARITRITPEGTDYLDPSTFLAMTHSLVDLGAYTSFYEVEVARRVERFGDIAQVWSVYETRRNKHARDALGRGVNSIQLIRENDTWRVLGLLWDETHTDPRLEPSSVFGRSGIGGQG
jgi:hypothetical protein